MPKRLRIGPLLLEREGLAGVRIFDLASEVALCIDVLSPEGCKYKLYTHSHPNHFPERAPLDAFSPAGPFLVRPGETLNLPPFEILTVHAYNREDLGRPPRHKKGESVGYLVSHGRHKVYHVGDSDLVSEIVSLREFKIDVALVPIGGSSVMNVEEAFEFVKSLRPSIAVPIHYSSLRDAEKFKLLSHVYTQIVILS
ncbi:MAG: MBL fold metallo-hydrolase [Acidilobaceae archaeon]